jgi:hypothetical protein
MLCEPLGVGLVVFVDRSVLGIPAVPAHWRRCSEDGFLGGGLRRRSAAVSEEERQDHY